VIKLYSWNVNGIRAATKKGFLDWVNQAQPDVLCIQETKAHPDQLEDSLRSPENYHTYWSSAERKGYSGVALYSRVPPDSVELGLGIDSFDREGRTILADYGAFVLLTSYVPNGSRDHSRVPFKMEYKAALLEKCDQLREAGRSVIFCGDINTAHKEIDLARPKSNKESTGFLPIERAWLDQVVESGYVDSYRALHPDTEGGYTWWAYWGKARERNVGWRIDYFFISPDLKDRIVQAEIHPDVYGSDHCPVSLALDL
jgi:exodeoxyribonuclease-3